MLGLYHEQNKSKRAYLHIVYIVVRKKESQINISSENNKCHKRKMKMDNMILEQRFTGLSDKVISEQRLEEDEQTPQISKVNPSKTEATASSKVLR